MNLPPNFEEYDYIAKRRIEYGGAKQQLEYIVENGVDAFIARNQAIKAKYPAPDPE